MKNESLKDILDEIEDIRNDTFITTQTREREIYKLQKEIEQLNKEETK